MLLADFIKAGDIALGVLKHIRQTGFDLDATAMIRDLLQTAVKSCLSLRQQRLGRVLVPDRNASFRMWRDEVHGY